MVSYFSRCCRKIVRMYREIVELMLAANFGSLLYFAFPVYSLPFFERRTITKNELPSITQRYINNTVLGFLYILTDAR